VRLVLTVDPTLHLLILILLMILILIPLSLSKIKIKNQEQEESPEKKKAPRLSPGRLETIGIEGGRLVAACRSLAAAAAEIATGTATGAIFAGTGLIYGKRATMEIFPMEKADGLARLLIGRHGHESESAGFAGEFVLHEGCFSDAACLGEEVLQVHFGGVEGKIPDVEFVTH
jgi:hypothetical protein